MSFNLIPIKPLFIDALETGLNRYLALDEHLQQLLLPMAGKVIALHITHFDMTIYLCLGQDRIQLLEEYAGEYDARISGSLAALGWMGLSKTPLRSLFTGKVSIDGDTLLAQKFQRLFEKLDINLETKLARYTNDQFAQRVSEIGRHSRHWTEHSLSSFRLNLQEFLQEETRDLPAKAEADEVFQQIDNCRSDMDRLVARIERLQTGSSE